MKKVALVASRKFICMQDKGVFVVVVSLFFRYLGWIFLGGGGSTEILYGVYSLASLDNYPFSEAFVCVDVTG